MSNNYDVMFLHNPIKYSVGAKMEWRKTPQGEWNRFLVPNNCEFTTRLSNGNAKWFRSANNQTLVAWSNDEDLWNPPPRLVNGQEVYFINSHPEEPRTQVGMDSLQPYNDSLREISRSAISVYSEFRTGNMYGSFIFKCDIDSEYAEAPGPRPGRRYELRRKFENHHITSNSYWIDINIPMQDSEIRIIRVESESMRNFLSATSVEFNNNQEMQATIDALYDRINFPLEGDNMPINNENTTTNNEREPMPRCSDCHQESNLGGGVYLRNVYLTQNQNPFSRYCAECITLYRENGEFGYCDGCDVYYETESVTIHYIESYDTNYCDRCIENSDFEWCEDCCEWGRTRSHECFRDRTGINSYSYKPEPVFYGNGPAFMGIELEIEATDNSQMTAEQIARLFSGRFGIDNFYAKSDGSLTVGQGVEIVSHPRDLDSWRVIADEMAETLQTVSLAGGKSWDIDKCGLHIHVSKNAFVSNTHQAMFGLAIIRNQVWAERLAGRSAFYANFDRLQRPGAILSTIRSPWSAEHRDAVNYGNDHTIEVRIFRPSLSIGRIMACLEFMDGLRIMTQQVTVNDFTHGALHYRNIEDFFNANANKYPHAIHNMNGGRFQVTNVLSNAIMEVN